MIASLKADSDRWLNEKRESNRRREPEPGTYQSSYSPSASSGVAEEQTKVRLLNADEGWPEYFHSQAWRESRRRAAPIIPELPAPHEPRPEPPPIDPRYPLPDPYGRGTVPPNVGHGGHGGHGGRTVYDPPPPNFAPQNYRADQRYAINPQQQYPSHGHPHDSGPAETQLDPYRNQYPPPKYPGPPNPPSFQPVPDQPQRPQQPQPDHGAYYRDYRQQQPYYPPHGPPSD